MICISYPSVPGTVVLDIDTQARFFRDGDVLCVQRPRAVLARIRRLLTWARRAGLPIVSTVQVPAKGGAPDPAGAKAPGTLLEPHVVLPATDRLYGGPAWCRPGLQWIVAKRVYDPFEEPAADHLLTRLPAATFIVLGVPLEGAVRATVLGLLQRGRRVVLAADAVGHCDPQRAAQTWPRLRVKRALEARSARWIMARRWHAAVAHGPAGDEASRTRASTAWGTSPSA